MSKLYITSDLHLCDEENARNIRGMNIDEHDAMIINNINKTVSCSDKLIILGDIARGYKNVKELYDKLSQFNCTVELVVGNHDDDTILSVCQDCCILLNETMDYDGCILTHIPIHETQFFGNIINVHGHIHMKYNYCVLPKNYYNVNVEFHKYLPIEWSVIKKYKEDYEKLTQT